jgi:hypothetical protein
MSNNPEDPASYTQSKAGVLYGIAIGFAALSTIVVSLRLYTRAFILRTLGSDDYSMLVALVCRITISCHFIVYLLTVIYSESSSSRSALASALVWVSIFVLARLRFTSANHGLSLIKRQNMDLERIRGPFGQPIYWSR